MELENRYLVFVVILNWNRPADTIDCVNSLEAQREVSLKVYIIDNGSTDDSITILKKAFPWLHVVELKNNLGYAGGMNIGIRTVLDAGANYILLLNNDTIADPYMVKNLLSELGPGIGITSPIIYYHDQPARPWSVGGNIAPWFLEQITPHRVWRWQIPKKPVVRTFFTGCALLVKREVFQQVGLFDERFYPAYYEDIDFCFRLLQAKIKMLLVPEAKLWHKISSSSGGEDNPMVRYLLARNGAYYNRKHIRWWQFPFVLTYRFARSVWTSMKLLLSKDWVGLSALWDGLIVGWTDLRKESEDKYLDKLTNV
jgi:GT2 family glycosyltransferase